MNQDRVAEALRSIIKEIRENRIIDNIAIKGDIFMILENSCTVIYYPIPKEKTRGFHIKRIVNDKLEDFVYINTDKPMAEQVFGAAHEYGHILNVARRVWELLGYENIPTEEEEEEITNLFAAELLMPHEAFRTAFFAHMKELNIKSGKVKVEEVVQIMVLLMNDFLVPYESVRKRFVETKIMNKESASVLESVENEILQLVVVLTNDQNTYLGKGTDVKTIPGIRELIEIAEENNTVDIYLLNKIKKDFDFSETPLGGTDIEIHIGDSVDE